MEASARVQAFWHTGTGQMSCVPVIVLKFRNVLICSLRAYRIGLKGNVFVICGIFYKASDSPVAAKIGMLIMRNESSRLHAITAK
jgi:hypothetical protein